MKKVVFGKVNLEVVRLMKWRREGKNPGRCKSDPELRGKGQAWSRLVAERMRS